MPPAVAALNIGVGPCWGGRRDAMARIASCINSAISLDPDLPGQIPENGSLDVDTYVSRRFKWIRKEYWRDGGKMRPPPRRQNPQFYVQPSSGFSDPPVVRRLLK